MPILIHRYICACHFSFLDTHLSIGERTVQKASVFRGSNFPYAISSTSMMKSRYSQPDPSRLPATADRRHQVTQQLQEPQAQAGGCACPVPVECGRGRAQDSVSRSNSAVPEQKTEIGPSSSGKVNVFLPSIVCQRRV